MLRLHVGRRHGRLSGKTEVCFRVGFGDIVAGTDAGEKRRPLAPNRFGDMPILARSGSMSERPMVSGVALWCKATADPPA
jgi:hypothetical protein